MKAGTSQLLGSLNNFPQIFVTFKNKYLATHNCVKDWAKVAPRQGWEREPPAGLGWG